MKNSAELCLAFLSNEDQDALVVQSPTYLMRIGGALNVQFDKTGGGVLTFRNGSGVIGAETVATGSPLDLGRKAAELGYPVEPGCEALVGLYIDSALEDDCREQNNSTEPEPKNTAASLLSTEPATKAAQ